MVEVDGFRDTPGALRYAVKRRFGAMHGHPQLHF